MFFNKAKSSRLNPEQVSNGCSEVTRMPPLLVYDKGSFLSTVQKAFLL